MINGDNDTLMSTQDSVDLADAAPNGTVILYPDAFGRPTVCGMLNAASPMAVSASRPRTT